MAKPMIIHNLLSKEYEDIRKQKILELKDLIKHLVDISVDISNDQVNGLICIQVEMFARIDVANERKNGMERALMEFAHFGLLEAVRLVQIENKQKETN